MTKDYELFTKETQALFYNPKNNPIQRMLDFDYICKRETPSVAAAIQPGQRGFHKSFFGSKEIMIPIYPSIEEASKKHPNADVFINFASFRSAFNSSKQALQIPAIKKVMIIAEGIPERETRDLIKLAKEKNKLIIGPSTVGAIGAGKFRVANTAGTIENIIKCRLHRPGSVGIVSKSGGLTNEIINIVAKVTDGAYEAVALGGDAYPGSTYMDHVLRMEKNPEIKMIVVLGELGGKDEYSLIDAKKQGKIKKPLVIWVTGTCASLFPGEVQFGHAGAKSGKENESAQAKNKALKEAGFIVPNSFEDYDEKIKQTFEKLKSEGKIKEIKEEKVQELPLDYLKALKQGVIRKSTNFICTISDDRGEAVTYAGIPINEMIEKNYSLGDIISLLWFKKKLPSYGSKFIEMCLIIAADHGPCVSGAHNAIVASRAGKDLVSSLASGLLTIGPRFGGAVDGAAKYFKEACDSKLAPMEFVEQMKKKGIRIPGIGHRIKSKRNPDKRVELLKAYAKKNFPSTKYLDYALEVEKITLMKSENLILNVDGCIGILFMDLLSSSKTFNDEELKEVVDMGYLNGMFVLARSIGMIGHILDQKRLKAGLYRHPWDDVLFLDKEDKKK